ncbi:MAG: hypothetical protein IJ462_03105 [Clostridia bacterium]|nr:hypothetical protein [Clostridia bacterium]
MAQKNKTQLYNEQKQLIKQKKEAEAKAQKKKERIVIISFFAALLLIVAIVLTTVLMSNAAKNNGSYYREKIAIKSASHEVNYATFSCFVYDAYEDYKSKEGDLSYYGFDATKKFADQDYDDNRTWEDFFISQATDNVKKYLFLADEAVKNGFSLTTEQLAKIDTTVQTIADISVYGRGVNADDVREMLTLKALATEYSNKKFNDPTFTDAQLTEEYNKSKAAYDEMNYTSFFIDYGENFVAKTADEAKAIAQLIIDQKPTDAATLLAAGKKICIEKGYKADDEFTQYLSENSYVPLNETNSLEFQEFAYASKAGDMKIFEGQASIEVCLVLSPPAPTEVWKEDAETSIRNATYDGWYADGFAMFKAETGEYDFAEMVVL